MAYSMDFRVAVARAYDEGGSSIEVAEAMEKKVHVCTVSRTLARMGLPRKKSPRTPPSRIALT